MSQGVGDINGTSFNIVGSVICKLRRLGQELTANNVDSSDLEMQKPGIEQSCTSPSFAWRTTSLIKGMHGGSWACYLFFDL